MKWFVHQFNKRGTGHLWSISNNPSLMKSLCGRIAHSKYLQPESEIITRCKKCEKRAATHSNP